MVLSHDARIEYVEQGLRWSHADVIGAAGRVEEAVQERLWLLGGPGAFLADRSYGRALRDAQFAANAALISRSSQKAAKDVRVQAAAGRPLLTICCGKRLRRLPEEVLSKHAPDLLEHYGENIVPLRAGDGCWAIILDSTAERPPKEYCERCQSRNGKTMNAGLAKNTRKRLRDARHPHKLSRRQP